MSAPPISLAPDMPDLPAVVSPARAMHECPVRVTDSASTGGPEATDCLPCHDECTPSTDPCDHLGITPCPPSTNPCNYVDCNPDPGQECQTVYDAVDAILADLPVYVTSTVSQCVPSTDACNYVDCRIINGFLYGGGSGDFESNENKVCDAGDPGWLSDQDGDLEIDCLDNDNDGDLLTDELEYKNSWYDMNNPFTDGVVRDDWDVAPGTTDYELAGVDMPAIDLGDSGCDPGILGSSESEPADPYIRHHDDGETTLRVKFGANSSAGFTAESQTLLADPWTREDGEHPDSASKEPFDPEWVLDSADRAAVGPGAVSSNRYSLHHNVSAYGVDQAGEEPAIQLTFGLQDHDHDQGDEEEIDLADGAPLDAEWTYELREQNKESDPKTTNWTDPDGTCFAMVKGQFDDIVPQTTNDIAGYRAVNPHKMIYADTV